MYTYVTQSKMIIKCPLFKPTFCTTTDFDDYRLYSIGTFWHLQDIATLYYKA